LATHKTRTYPRACRRGSCGLSDLEPLWRRCQLDLRRNAARDRRGVDALDAGAV